MLDIKIRGTLPKINTDLTSTMVDVKGVMLGEIYGRFDTTGYGTWVSTRQGSPATLRGIRKTVKGSSGNNWAEVSAMSTIHQRGGLMVMTDRQRRYLWWRYKDVWTPSRGSGVSNVMMFQPREYMILRPDAIKKMRDALLKGIYTVKETIGGKV